jgi:hypothetical protein
VSDDLRRVLGASLQAARERWRVDEDRWTRATAEAWSHRRTMRATVVELMHRGDVVAIGMGPHVLSGMLSAAGDDYLVLRAGEVDVDVALDGITIIRVLRRAPSGGVRGAPVPRTWRARWLERELRADPVRVGTSVSADLEHGIPTIGADHLRLRARGTESVLPLRVVAFAYVLEPSAISPD